MAARKRPKKRASTKKSHKTPIANLFHRVAVLEKKVKTRKHRKVRRTRKAKR